MKRNRRFELCINDAEHALLERLEKSYNDSGIPVTKAFLFRYGLKLLPTVSPTFPQ